MPLLMRYASLDFRILNLSIKYESNTLLADKLHAHSNLQVKPDLSPISNQLTVTLKTSFTWYNNYYATTILKSRPEKLNDDLKAISPFQGKKVNKPPSLPLIILH